jgi:hypothetical protein
LSIANRRGGPNGFLTVQPLYYPPDIFPHPDKYEQHSIHFPEQDTDNRFPVQPGWIFRLALGMKCGCRSLLFESFCIRSNEKMNLPVKYTEETEWVGAWCRLEILLVAAMVSLWAGIHTIGHIFHVKPTLEELF